MPRTSRSFHPSLLLLFVAASAVAAELPCRPCAGVRVDDPLATAAALQAAPALAADATFVVALSTDLGPASSPAAARAVGTTGAEPLLRVHFTAPAPLTANLNTLQAELSALAELARQAGERARFQVAWQPSAGERTEAEYAFLLKRASVAITGAHPSAWVATDALPAAGETLDRLLAEEIAAYVEAVAFAPASDEIIAAACARLAELAPGLTPVVDGVPLPSAAAEALPIAARLAAAGAGLVLFAAPAPTTAELAPLVVLANEFRGELAYDPTSTLTGATGWAFVRGSDLGLRLVVVPPAAGQRSAITLGDSQLKDPERVDLSTGVAAALGGTRRTASGLTLQLPPASGAVIVRLVRPTAEELAGVAEEVTVAAARDLPVEEILRRLQATEDDQARRLRHYQAVNSTTMRFQVSAGVSSIDATFEGEFFFRQGQGFDWAWQTVYVGGVRWRGKSIPEIPIVQPEKAAAMPLQILLTKEYAYRARGRDTVNGRDCWVVDFEPAAAVEPGHTLYRGTVWVDRQLFVRVRSRTLQLGLDGEVMSNEETLDYSPVDAAGGPTAWGQGAFHLPLHSRGQQMLSVMNSATVVDREVVLSRLVVNGPDFDARREAVLASEATMVRDTEAGLRYLEKDPAGGERRVKEGFDTNKLFAVGGAFYDDALDFPLPLLGIDYFDLDFRGGKRQLNAFFGGVLGTLSYADPRFAGSSFDLGVNLFAFAYPLSDTVYRGGDEIQGEEVRSIPARVTLNLGHALGAYGKLTLSYDAAYRNYRRGDETDPAFAIPSDHVEQSLSAEVKLSRSAYRLSAKAGYHRRSTWDAWGFPGNPEWSPAQRDYLTWEAAASKNWYFKSFQKLGVELNYSGGDDLDRFSKYGFGFFGGNRVHGYQIGKVRAEEAFATHLSYGFEIGKVIRLDLIGDLAWATDRVAGLERELLAGVGLSGSLVGPWETLINLDLGVAVDGPDDGFSVYIAILKLFH